MSRCVGAGRTHTESIIVPGTCPVRWQILRRPARSLDCAVADGFSEPDFSGGHGPCDIHRKCNAGVAARAICISPSSITGVVMSHCFFTISRKSAALLHLLVAGAAVAAGDPARGVRDFQPCMACHSVKPGEHSTGPSLASLWNRKAGSAEGFTRYTSALREFNVTWTETSLDKWLSSPQKFVPGTSMSMQGITDPQERADLIAYLKAVSDNMAPDMPSQVVMTGKRRR
jgi:cytochrome c